MSYHLYHTHGFVLGSAPRGEGNRSFTLFTRELGLITATAQSVREERSKLRYGLAELSLSDITLVRGKDSWRLTSALCIENLYATFHHTPETVKLFGRIFRLLRRLVAGEEQNEQLFKAIEEAVEFLKRRGTDVAGMPVASGTNAEISKTSAGEESQSDNVNIGIGTVEIVLVLRILHILGYLAPRGEFGDVLSDVSLWSDSLLSDAKGWKALALADINESLKATQL